MQRSLIGRIARRAQVNLARATLIDIEWTVTAGGTTDPTTGSNTGGTVTVKKGQLRALVHLVGASKALRQFAEVEVGDCMLDLAPDAALDGKKNLRFFVNGEWWTQKPVGSSLASAWDALAGGQRLFRTVLLSKAT